MRIAKLCALIATLIAYVFTPAAPSANAADLREVVGIYVATNAIWFEGETAEYPVNVEAGATARASLSPHLSAVGSAYRGLDKPYWRWAAGARVTATDVDNRNFSIGLGIQYQAGSPALLPREWAPDASFGWRLVPDQAPRLLVVGQGSYGLTSREARALVGLRYELPY